jgi:hypothetical protein
VELEMLDQAISALLERLKRAALPETPQPEVAEPNKIPGELCEYADNLRSKSQWVRRLRDEISSIEKRLEL